ncbi:MptD family putative ECF transporter S component [Gemmiger formicilis]|uniref:MptD family putative ECF transporter S component n=1 Tax=Gemmiger formicilis TaxID=745368 RepID=UPI003CE757D9
MENTNKLTGKDLINVGIYSAMTLVIFFVVGLLTALPVVYPFLFVIWPIVCGIPMMLYYTKIKKFGMLTITGIIGGIFSYNIFVGSPTASSRVAIQLVA